MENFNSADEVLTFFNSTFERFGISAYSADSIGNGCWEVHFDAMDRNQLRKALPVFNPLVLIDVNGTMVPRCLLNDKAISLVGDFTKTLLFKVDKSRCGFYCRNNDDIIKIIIPLKEVL